MAFQNVVNVSAGKDSTAMLLLALERGMPNLLPVFADTGHEHPTTYEYIAYLEQALDVEIRRVRADFEKDFERKRNYIANNWPDDLKERGMKALDKTTGIPFLDLAILKGRFPSTKAKFCTGELKSLPIQQQVEMPLLHAGHRIISWQGVRKEESRDRELLTHSSLLDLGVIAYRPILEWKVDEVFAMHRKHRVEPNPLYSQGMSRVGCMPCINARKGEMAEIANRFSDVIERIAEWEEIVSDASKRGCATFWPARGETEVTLERHGINSVVDWSRTSHGGRQFDLIASTEGPQCSSVYGLCE